MSGSGGRETVGLRVPESVRYDPELDVYYIANINGNPSLGRKAWLFAGSERGAERAAAMATLITTAKLNQVAVGTRVWAAFGRSTMGVSLTADGEACVPTAGERDAKLICKVSSSPSSSTSS